MAATLSKQMRQQMRRSSFVPEQKLEELRDLRIQLDKDKQEWQAKFNRMQEQLLNERRELDLAREQLKQDRQQVANEREQLYRKLDALKEKGILLSPSHKVIITAPEQTAARPPQSSGAFLCPQSGSMPYLLGQQQVNLRQPIMRNANNSIRIHQHQQQQPLGLNHQQVSELMQPRFVAANQQVSKLATATTTATTNLFIQSSRVPLHLSESSPPSIGAQPKQTTLSKVTTPLISVIGNNLFGSDRLTGTSQRPSAHRQHLESHVI